MEKDTNKKPYNALSNYYVEKYGQKVAKITLNAGFTCPNRDGKKGTGGCTYCSNLGSGDLAGNSLDSLAVQFEKQKSVITKKWHNCAYIPYFQAFSNTYDSLDKLSKLYYEAISLDSKVVGLDIATRPDCIDEGIVLLLAQINQIKPVTVELGLQTSNEKTAESINRRSTNQEFTKAVNLLRRYQIEVVVHIINGLPNETKEDMLNTIFFLNQHNIQGIKFHSLLILEKTKMALEYSQKPFHILSLEEYVHIVVEQIRHLNPRIIIHRLAADGVLSDLIEPKWTIKKLVVMNEIDKLMRKNHYYQGELFIPENLH